MQTYTRTAKVFHWITVLFLCVQIPVGVYMVYRGVDLDLWDDLTNFLYSSHKVLGVIILFWVIARLVHRFVAGVPDPEPSITKWQRTLSKAVHTSIYVLLILTPVFGYLGISYFPAFDAFGSSLPNIFAISADSERSAEIFEAHKRMAWLLVALAALHVAGVLYHHFIRRDQVLGRMWRRFERR